MSRMAIINGICGGVIGFCFEKGWQRAVGILAVVIVVINSAIPTD